MKEYFTDYPFVELGDIEYQKAPIRKIVPLYFDGNKYMKIKVEDIESSIKIGYIYTEPKRFGEIRGMWGSEAMRFFKGE
jgi:hypothetical protein